MRRATLFSLVLLAACNSDEESNPQSSPTDPTADWTDADTDTDTDSDTDADTDADTDTDADLAIVGEWFDSMGGLHVIDAATWTQTYPAWDTASEESVYVFNISQFDNDSSVLIAQNDSTNAYNPDLWSRFDWTGLTDGSFWYCQTSYDAKTEKDALATPAADSTDPATGGCGDYPWTELTLVGDDR